MLSEGLMRIIDLGGPHQIGMEVSDNLKRQTDALNKIKDDVDQIDSNLKRADKQIRMFMR